MDPKAPAHERLMGLRAALIDHGVSGIVGTDSTHRMVEKIRAEVTRKSLTILPLGNVKPGCHVLVSTRKVGDLDTLAIIREHDSMTHLVALEPLTDVGDSEQVVVIRNEDISHGEPPRMYMPNTEDCAIVVVPADPDIYEAAADYAAETDNLGEPPY